MKILYIITQADGGGAQNYVLTLARHFNGAIAAGNESVALFNQAKALQLTTYNLQHLKRNINPFHDFLAIFEIRKLIRAYRPDIVHLNSTKAGFLGSLACAGLKTKAVPRTGQQESVDMRAVPRTGQQNWTGTRVIFTAHGFRFLEPLSRLSKYFYLGIEKLASYFRDFIITVSEADMQAAIQHNLINKNKLTTIYNGLPEITFLAKDESRAQLHLPQNIILFGTIANFYKTKGLDILIKAASKLHKSILDKCKFVIIGDGPELENCKLEIANLGLVKSFVLMGNIPNASQYLKAFDVFVLPSRKEGFPYAILEAMQAGLPIIGTKAGGVPEALGKEGLLVPTNNEEALTKAIGDLLREENKKDRLISLSLERSKLFTQEKMLKETEKVYQQKLLS